MTQITQSELNFYNSIKTRTHVIFDVGCRDDSLFLQEEKIVHYFDPIISHIDKLRLTDNKNIKSYFNGFGLSDETTDAVYYNAYDSFVNRYPSLGDYGRGGDQNISNYKLIKSIEYIREHAIDKIDFLKIDVEGFESKVIRGFENFLSNIQIIQFEYGGTWLDANTTLSDTVKYLQYYNFNNFSYIIPDGLELISDQVLLDNTLPSMSTYCNIVCFNKSFF